MSDTRIRCALTALSLLAVFAVSACTTPDSDASADADAAATDTGGGPLDIALQDSTQRVAQITGFAGPEAVRYDPDQDVWFVANFGESGEDPRDGNGFISRVGAEGTIEELRFMIGTSAAPLHMARGMAIRGDTLWVADVDGVHGFDRHTGVHLRFVDMSEYEPGFINDLAFDSAGVLYATDSGLGRVYRIGADRATIAVEDERTGPPNGITWDDARAAFLLGPWRGETLRAWDPATGAFADVAALPAGRIDGLEFTASGLLLASQADSSLYLFDGSGTRAVVRVGGAPADIGFDAGRSRVAVPYVALNRVDIWRVN